MSGALAQPPRMMPPLSGGILAMILKKPATIHDIEQALHIAGETANGLMKVLQQAGLIEHPTVTRIISEQLRRCPRQSGVSRGQPGMANSRRTQKADRGAGMSEPVAIPRERVFIDTISLDQEIQLERELIDDELRPIEAAWAAYEPRATWPQPLPMRFWQPRLHEGPYTALQIQFLQHLFYTGQIGAAAGEFHHLGFKTAYEIFRSKWGDYPASKVVESMDLMSELRAVA